MRTRTSGGQLYRAVPAGYDVTITGVAEGATRTVIGGVRYAVTVHAHAYTATVTTAATCTTPGVRTYACACGESYTEEIPAMGHSYVRTEENGNYVYTCSACGDSYTEPVKTATYDSVSRLTSGGRYVLTVYANGGYYAMTHDGHDDRCAGRHHRKRPDHLRRDREHALGLLQRLFQLPERHDDILPL